MAQQIEIRGSVGSESKIEFIFRIFLIIFSIIGTVYTYSAENKPAYISSIIAVLGITALLLQYVFTIKK